MVGVLAVVDFRDSESWNLARLAVCTIIERTESWSRRKEFGMLANRIDHLSVAILDTIAREYDGSGNSNCSLKASNAIDRLKDELGSVQQEGILSSEHADLLKENLEAVKRHSQTHYRTIPHNFYRSGACNDQDQ
jgi:hypothetical protein